jgi:hypothetical protein
MAGKQSKALSRVVGLGYWREAQARVVVEAWQESGEGLSAFARRHGIEPRRLSRWAATLEGRDEAVRFHPVRLVERRERVQSSGAPIEIVIGDGCSVRVPPGFAAEDLERVLSVLAVEAAC